MNIISYYKHVMTGIHFPIKAVNGTPPYTYEVLPDGAGGTITPEGIYKAPSKAGVDTIKATDDLGEEAEFQVSVGTHLHFIADIISREMGLEADQIIIGNQKFTIPNDSRIYLSVKEVFTRVIGSSSKYKPDVGLENEQVIYFMSNVDVSIKTRSLDEYAQRFDIALALDSDYAKRQKELNSVGISKHPLNIASVNAPDGAAIPYFANFNYNINFKVTKSKSVEYFDSFKIDGVITNE